MGYWFLRVDLNIWIQRQFQSQYNISRCKFQSGSPCLRKFR